MHELITDADYFYRIDSAIKKDIIASSPVNKELLSPDYEAGPHLEKYTILTYGKKKYLLYCRRCYISAGIIG